MSGIAYEYIGGKPFFVDKHAGTGLVWNGKGNVQEIDPSLVEDFERIYVNCIPLAGAQMRRVTPETAIVEGDPDLVPAGTGYSAYSRDQLVQLFKEKTGKNPSPRMSAVNMIKAIQEAALTLASLGETVEEY